MCPAPETTKATTKATLNPWRASGGIAIPSVSRLIRFSELDDVR